MIHLNLVCVLFPHVLFLALNLSITFLHLFYLSHSLLVILDFPDCLSFTLPSLFVVTSHFFLLRSIH